MFNWLYYDYYVILCYIPIYFPLIPGSLANKFIAVLYVTRSPCCVTCRMEHRSAWHGQTLRTAERLRGCDSTEYNPHRTVENHLMKEKLD